MKKTLLVFIIFFCQLSEAQADCFPKHGEEMIEQSDLIFIGRSTKTNPYWMSYISPWGYYNYYTTFQIDEVLKGKPLDSVNIFYRYDSSVSPTTPPLKENKFSIFMVRKDSKSGQYYYSACSGRQLSLEMLDSTISNEHVIADFAQVLKSYPNIKNGEIAGKMKRLVHNARREVIKWHLVRKVFEAKGEKELNIELSKYDLNPEKYICSNTLNVQESFLGMSEVLLDCD